MDINIGDKIVYDWHINKDYILVQKIENGMINGKYAITGPLREPTPLELEVALFTC